jgi:hypothetical protein
MYEPVRSADPEHKTEKKSELEYHLLFFLTVNVKNNAVFSREN